MTINKTYGLTKNGNTLHAGTSSYSNLMEHVKSKKIHRYITMVELYVAT